MAKDIIRKITDVISILFPAIIAVLGVLQLTGAAAVTHEVEQIALIVCGAASAIASVIYNQVTKKE